jgi:hypothetical protein
MQRRPKQTARDTIDQGTGNSAEDSDAEDMAQRCDNMLVSLYLHTNGPALVLLLVAHTSHSSLALTHLHIHHDKDVQSFKSFPCSCPLWMDALSGDSMCAHVPYPLPSCRHLPQSTWAEVDQPAGSHAEPAPDGYAAQPAHSAAQPAAETAVFKPLPPPRLRLEPVRVEFTKLETPHLPARCVCTCCVLAACAFVWGELGCDLAKMLQTCCLC